MVELTKKEQAMKYEELKAQRNELLRKAEEARHAPDPFNTNNGAIYANKYQKQADEILREICGMKGVSPVEIGL